MNNPMLALGLAAVFGYFIGSIPFGLLLTRAAGLGDIRAIGSGNIGATNVLRTGNKKLAAATLLLDGAKGAAAVLLPLATILLSGHLNGMAGTTDPAPLCEAAGLFAVLGHVFPVWLNFKGGKGVATALGTLLALAPWAGVCACLIWLAMAFTFRYSSLAALIALLAAPLLAYFIYHDVNLAAVCGLITLLLWWRHRENIQRLLAGEEPKVGRKKEAV